MQDCWATSDNRASFEQALQDRGYKLAKGDRRGYVVLDLRCEVFSVSKKWIGVTAKAVREKLDDGNELPTVEQTRSLIAKDIQERLQIIQEHHHERINTRQQTLDDLRVNLIAQQKEQRANLAADQETRWQEETRQRQARFRTGLKGLMDRVTGRTAELRQENELAIYLAQRRDQQERDELIFKHIEQRQTLDQRKERLENFRTEQTTKLQSDIQQYKEVEQQKRDVVDFKQEMKNQTPELER